ncbi:unnamed protein product [Aureobasidium vineae]|uniref:RZ-type domain-containing protein n=1 Tax=Aureobasidium vineae TaxID=2773715 RepID=A0A9N8JCQ4_9PEZI|nr:unnamed protein product [Aureobasidium vineae]
MDGHLSLVEHYDLDADGLPIALKVPDDGLDVDKTRIVCPDCRRSLRELPRYGRVVRRALLIQSTLNFITWSNNDYVKYYESFSGAQKALKETLEQARPAETNLRLDGSRDQQMHTIKTAMSKLRYEKVLKLRWKIHDFKGQVGSHEQPFKRVQTLVRHARLNKRTEGDFTFDESVILQTRSDKNATDTLRTQARERLEQARIFCAQHSQARMVASEIEEIEKMLRESTFFQPITNEEMDNVVKAMAREFRGTGHWYRCRNGHPFTVGECGGLVTESVCPQCGEPVGGRNYHAAEGVTRAVDLETGIGNMRL